MPTHGKTFKEGKVARSEPFKGSRPVYETEGKKIKHRLSKTGKSDLERKP